MCFPKSSVVMQLCKFSSVFYFISIIRLIVIQFKLDNLRDFFVVFEGYYSARSVSVHEGTRTTNSNSYADEWWVPEE